MRITVIGLAGSGKSTLADAISKKLSIPHIRLDKFWFEAGGHASSRSTPDLEKVRAEVKEQAQQAIKEESWVSDGSYLHIQEEISARADVILFLNIPLIERLFNHAQRLFSPTPWYMKTNRWEDIKFFFEIVRREFAHGPKLKKFVHEHQNKVVVFKRRKEISDYLKNL